MTWLTSDNAGPVAPEIMAALADANSGYASGYGADALMDQVRDQIRDIFEAPDASVHLVPTGTAANALALACLANPWDAIYCGDQAHVEWDECGAPEFFTGGAKMVVIDGENGQFTPDALAAKLQTGTRTDVHQMQRGAVTITNTTELGAVYTAAEIAALCAVAREFDMPCHLDGARFANAIAATGARPAEMTWKAGIDAVSFGGTKNGCMGVEAVILFDPKRDWEFQLRRKRAGHLFSKHRYLSAQMAAYLQDGLWLTLAARANAASARLKSGLEATGARLIHGAGANMLFAEFTTAQHKDLQAKGMHYYLWPHTAHLDGLNDAMVGCRLVTNWSTTDAEIDAFVTAVAG